MLLHHRLVKLRLRDREVACSASNLQGLNFESCVWRAMSSHSSHHLQEVPLVQFSLDVDKIGLRPDSFHFIFTLSTGKPQRSHCYSNQRRGEHTSV